MYCCNYHAPIGKLTIASTDVGICGIWIEGQKHFPAVLPMCISPEEGPQPLFLVCRWLDAYFAGEEPDISSIPIDPHGSDFQILVWKHLCSIPYGCTATYGQLADTIAQELGITKMSAQAIGGAVGRNPISILIPCHRVIGVRGQLTGYAGGLSNKHWLLQHENKSKKQIG